MQEQLDEAAVVHVSPGGRRHLWERAGELEKRVGTQNPSSADLAEMGASTVAGLPGAVVRAVHRFVSEGNPDNALLIRGIGPGLTSTEPTPSTVLPAHLGPGARAGQLALLGVASLLGAPFTFASLYEGRLVQHVTPVPGDEEAQTSGGSDSFLTWHVEDAWSKDRCDYFALLCLRGDETASTLYSPIRSAVLDYRWEAVLRQPRFVVLPDLAHGADAAGPLEPVSVLTGPTDDPEICYDALYMAPRDTSDIEAVSALKHLGSALEESAKAQVLEPGDLLILDNRRVVHARTSFKPRYDGADRWLLRAMVCASLRTHRRRGGSRAIA